MYNNKQKHTAITARGRDLKRAEPVTGRVSPVQTQLCVRTFLTRTGNWFSQSRHNAHCNELAAEKRGKSCSASLFHGISPIQVRTRPSTEPLIIKLTIVTFLDTYE